MSRVGMLTALCLFLGDFTSHHSAIATNIFTTPTTPKVSIPGIDTNTVKHFDCPETTKCKGLSQNQLQAAMDEFAYLFYTEKNLKEAFGKYVASNYVQHNPTIGDGRDAAITALGPLFGAKDTTFDIARVMVGPEYTTIHIRKRTVGEPDLNVMDVYRTQGSCIIEHWDCLQQISNATQVNPHPYF